MSKFDPAQFNNLKEAFDSACKRIQVGRPNTSDQVKKKEKYKDDIIDSYNNLLEYTGKFYNDLGKETQEKLLKRIYSAREKVCRQLAIINFEVKLDDISTFELIHRNLVRKINASSQLNQPLASTSTTSQNNTTSVESDSDTESYHSDSDTVNKELPTKRQNTESVKLGPGHLSPSIEVESNTEVKMAATAAEKRAHKKYLIEQFRKEYDG